MASFIIEGGYRLKGEILPQGAKNEALQVLCAVLLTEEPVHIKNIPDIVDVNNQIRLLEDMGVEVTRHDAHDYTFSAKQLDDRYLSSEAYMERCRQLRGSVMMLGPLLARRGKAIVAKPGGDQIGRRRLDTHFHGIQQLGGRFTYDEALHLYNVEAERLEGAYMLLDEASVTGTANIIMTAVLAKGVTTIYNAACEPYIQQLCKMLCQMGARIAGIGSNLLTIDGVESLHGTTHTILPDMIEVGSFIGMAAMVGDGVRICNASPEHLGIIPSTFRRLGIRIETEGADLFIPRQEHYEIESFIDGSFMTLSDAPWPGFTPDLLSVLLVVSTQAKGSVLIHQKMFESRLFFVDQLQGMGAQITLCDPHRAIVIGLHRRKPLRATVMASPDIRAGVSLLIAALSAKGVSTIQNVEQIDRGYQHIVERLNALGAVVERRK